MTLNYGYITGIFITSAIFAIALWAQLSAREYVPLKFWTVIIATTTLGTEISDFMDRTLNFGYLLGSLLLFCGLLLTLFLWFRKFGTLDVDPIFERRKEFLFWTAVLFSNSLGTAFGDFLNDILSLSYLNGAIITGAIILSVVLLHYFTKFNRILLFWIAFIFTRPFGATFGDFLTKPVAKGGLDLGTLNASVISMVLMALMIAVSQNNKRKIGSVSQF